MPSLKRITAPAKDAVLIEQAKVALGLPAGDGDEDELLETLIAAATQDVEDYLGKPLVNQAWRVVFDRSEIGRRRWDFDSEWAAALFDLRVDLPLARVSAVTAVRAYDMDGAQTVLDPADYSLVARSEESSVYLDSGALPSDFRPTQALEVEVTAGLGADSEAIDAKSQRAILKLVAFDFENRGDADLDGARLKLLRDQGLARAIRL